jgi:SWI/SNF-related matrix-associated actin-dependent regulator of chromatin subfamily A3
MTQAQRLALEKQQVVQRAAYEKQRDALRRAAELKAMLSSLEKVDDEGRRASLLDTLCGQELDDILGLPEHPSPPGKTNGELKVDLLKHQCQALQWCLSKEYPVLPKKEADKPVQFWQYKVSGSKVRATCIFKGLLTRAMQYSHSITIVSYLFLATFDRISILGTVATRTPQAEAPRLGRGGLNADAMGLVLFLPLSPRLATHPNNSQGKTLTMISL